MSSITISHEFDPNQSIVRTESVMTSSQNLSWFKYESIVSSIRISHQFEPYQSRLLVKINHFLNPNQSWVKSELIMTQIQNNQFRNTKAPNQYNSWIKSDSVMSSNRISHDFKSKFIMIQIRINYEFNPNQSSVRTVSFKITSQN